MRALVGILIVLLLTGCSGAGNSLKSVTSTPNPAQISQPTIEELTEQLQADFDRLGIDPAKVPAAVPSGSANDVFDLAAAIVDPDGEGPESPTGIELTWTEQMVGDYDQNGEVNSGDITPLGLNFGAMVDYSPPDPPGEPAWWPSGDPAGEGALNWRLARIDGDHNGELNVGDVTPLAQHWNEKLGGYCIYQKTADSEEYEMMPGEPGNDFTVSRADAIVGGTPAAGEPVRCHYFMEITDPGSYTFGVSDYDRDSGEEGGMMQSCSLTINAPPVAALSADPTAGAAPLLVEFDASGSTDNKGIVLYEWDYDGDSEYTETTTEPYSEYEYWLDGDFDATVRVTDAEGLTDTASVTISVNGFETGLYIMPDPDDADWDNITGSGVEADPYVFTTENTSDYSTEFSLIAYDVTSGSAVPVDPADLNWWIDPPFLLTWVSPGTFKVNIFTSHYIVAEDSEMQESNHLYVVSLTEPD